MSYVKITKCLGSGIQFINPLGSIEILNSTISNCLGHALDVTLINGDPIDPLQIRQDQVIYFFLAPINI